MMDMRKTQNDIYEDMESQGVSDFKTIEKIVGVFFDCVKESVADGDKVVIYEFGSFEPKDRAARTARNPRTGESIEVPEKTVPTFKPSKAFKDLFEG